MRKTSKVIHIGNVDMWRNVMDRLKLMRIFSEFEEFSEGDLTPEEMEEFLRTLEDADRPRTPEEWKAAYFEFYDDVKDKTLKKQDW